MPYPGHCSLSGFNFLAHIRVAGWADTVTKHETHICQELKPAINYFSDTFLVKEINSWSWSLHPHKSTNLNDAWKIQACHAHLRVSIFGISAATESGDDLSSSRDSRRANEADKMSELCRRLLDAVPWDRDMLALLSVSLSEISNIRT